jgi:predicted kinase
MKTRLIILMGLQGAGKSSFYRKYFSEGPALVSKDKMKNKKHKGLVQEKLIRQFLSNNQSVIVDNMNLTKVNRKELIQLGREYGAEIILYFFPLTVDESFERNKGPNRKEVPPVGIYSAAKAFEFPEKSEGFDEMYTVRMINHDKFAVGRWDPVMESHA